MSDLPPAIFLMGPTASGKTSVAVELVQKMPVEIISVDSALVYRDMDIGTAKPDAATRARAPHHLINILCPTEAYSAAAFRRDALRLMAGITARHRIPLLVGGTMLYFKALREGLSPLPQADAGVRTELDERAARLGWPALHGELAKIDPATAARLKPNDAQRIQRALEIHRITGKPMSELIRLSPAQPSIGGSGGLCDALTYRVIPIALAPSDRSALHARIAARFEQMLKAGLPDELRSLRDRYPLHRDMASMRCVGYRQTWEYMQGEISEAELLEKGVAATRQLAKRQLTWLRAMPDNIEFDCLAPDLSLRVFDALQQQV